MKRDPRVTTNEHNLENLNFVTEPFVEVQNRQDTQTLVTSSMGATSFNKDDNPVDKGGAENTDSTRDLIMSAIGVMKSRKARPDTKRFVVKGHS